MRRSPALGFGSPSEHGQRSPPKRFAIASQRGQLVFGFRNDEPASDRVEDIDGTALRFSQEADNHDRLTVRMTMTESNFASSILGKPALALEVSRESVHRHPV